MTRTQRTVILP